MAMIRHQGYTCDGCNMFPLMGPRYHCKTCVDYDLCHACFSKEVHCLPGHPFALYGSTALSEATNSQVSDSDSESSSEESDEPPVRKAEALRRTPSAPETGRVDEDSKESSTDDKSNPATQINKQTDGLELGSTSSDESDDSDSDSIELPVKVQSLVDPVPVTSSLSSSQAEPNCTYYLRVTTPII